MANQDVKTRGKYGFCPKCGGDWLRKFGTRPRATGRVQAYRCNDCETETSTPRAPHEKVHMKDTLPKVQRYIITSAQNATPVHKALWGALKTCAEWDGEELVVLPGRYKNPTSQWTQGNDDHEWWDEEVVPYLVKGRVSLGDRLVLLGDVKIQWAAMNPLASMEALTGEKSGIVGHPRRELKSVATPQHKQPKMMYTTGCCTQPNYTDTKQGKIAQFNHAYGGLVVEVEGDRFHVRQLNAMQNGSFIDLVHEFRAGEVREAKRALGLTMGDTHAVHMDGGVYEATMLGMIPVLKPRYLVWHDVLDQYARNHHHRGNWMVDWKKEWEGTNDVRKEVEMTLGMIENETPEDTQSIVVSSNHDRALGRWLLEEDFRRDPKNADFFLEVAGKVLRAMRDGEEDVDPFVLYGREWMQGVERVKFLNPNESFVLAGVEHGLHGDIGPNGSRGTTRNLSKIGVKVTKGHSHSAEIVAGCYSVGKSTGRLEYEKGPSSSSQTHCVQYANGKRTLITIVNGKWRLE